MSYIGETITRLGIPLLVILLLAGSVAGCRRTAVPESDRVPAGASASSDDGIRISLVAPVFSPPAGDGRLAFRITDAQDQPVNTATLAIRGDMTHAGMLPIETSAASGEDGIYRVPVRWTMAGDWIITVDAVVSDGRRATRSFDMTVTGEEELCIDGP